MSAFNSLIRKFPKNFLKNNTAFSLVELLVVVALIGVLSSMAIVNFQNIKETAKQQKPRSCSLISMETRKFIFLNTIIFIITWKKFV